MQIGKQREDFLHRHAALGDFGRQHQVFQHRQRGKDATLLRHEADAVMGGAMQGHLHQVLTAKGDRTLSGPHDAGNGAQRRGLAHTVAAEDGDGLALGDRQVDAVENMAFAVPGIQPAHIKKRGHQASSVPI